ncbi:MAG: energy transducer TonB [Leptospiraceae bacterium]|nr:energy transducer TonB [Leptospiraceae bacterium]MDW8307362.1 TonB family protein [Leptospiraceae bacterium]
MAACRENVFGVTEIFGIAIADGRYVFPGLCNSFLLEKRGGIFRRLLFLWSFLAPLILAVVLGVLGVILGIAIERAREAEYERMAFIVDFGDVRPLSRRTTQSIVEVDEVFGNQYVKKDAPIVEKDTSRSIDEIIESTPMGGVADYTAPVDLTPEIKAEYTPEARAAGIEGRIQLAIVIDENGDVKYVKPIGRRLGMGLEEAAIAAYKKKKYKPSYNKEGKPVTVKMYVAAVFRLS